MSWIFKNLVNGRRAETERAVLGRQFRTVKKVELFSGSCSGDSKIPISILHIKKPDTTAAEIALKKKYGNKMFKKDAAYFRLLYVFVADQEVSRFATQCTCTFCKFCDLQSTSPTTLWLF